MLIGIDLWNEHMYYIEINRHLINYEQKKSNNHAVLLCIGG
jgi:hypothetical protein